MARREPDEVCGEAALELFRRRLRDDDSLAFLHAGRCVGCGTQIPRTKTWCTLGCADSLPRTPKEA